LALEAGRAAVAPIESRIDEDEFQAMVKAEAVRCGWLYYHTRDSRKSDKGFPDTILIHEGRRLLIAAELKVGGKQPTGDQQTWLEAFQAVETVRADVWRPEDWALVCAMLRGDR